MVDYRCICLDNAVSEHSLAHYEVSWEDGGITDGFSVLTTRDKIPELVETYLAIAKEGER